MQIDFSDEQRSNADSPIIESRLPRSNAMAERDTQKEKQYLEMVSTDKGIEID
jgi:hypothetical protein